MFKIRRTVKLFKECGVNPTEVKVGQWTGTISARPTAENVNAFRNVVEARGNSDWDDVAVYKDEVVLDLHDFGTREVARLIRKLAK